MLDEEEFAVVSDLYQKAVEDTKEFRREHNLPLSACPTRELFRPVREAYRRMTGADEPNHDAIMHHRVSIYGPPCARCGKPLRTPRAAFCAACGLSVDAPRP